MVFNLFMYMYMYMYIVHECMCSVLQCAVYSLSADRLDFRDLFEDDEEMNEAVFFLNLQGKCCLPLLN